MSRNLFTIVVAVSACVASLTLSNSYSFADPASISNLPMLLFKTSNEVDNSSSKVIRTNEGISFDINTNGLQPGNPYTVWVIIIEGGESTIAVYGASGIAANDGSGHFGGSIQEGEIEPADGETILNAGDGNFDTSQTATIRLVVRGHGPKIPSRVGASKSALSPGPAFGTPYDKTASLISGGPVFSRRARSSSATQ